MSRLNGAFRAIDAFAVRETGMSDPGPLPDLTWLKISELLVDTTYKAPISSSGRRVVRAIARHFKWSRFAPVIVTPAGNGAHVIIDGQLRVAAAAARGFEAVPCSIVLADRDEQVRMLAALDGPQEHATMMQVYRGALAAGETWARDVSRSAAKAGVTVLDYALSKDSPHRPDRSTMAVGSIRHLIEQQGVAATEIILSLFGRTALGADRGRIGFLWITAVGAALHERPHWLSDPVRLSSFFDEMDHVAVARSAQQWRGSRTSAVQALAIELRCRLDAEWPAKISMPMHQKAIAR